MQGPWLQDRLLKISWGSLRGGNSPGLSPAVLFWEQGFCSSQASSDFYYHLIPFIESFLTKIARVASLSCTEPSTRKELELSIISCSGTQECPHPALLISLSFGVPEGAI